MSRLQRFLGRPQKFLINGEEMELKPLTVKDLDIILDLGDDKKRNAALQQVISRTLRRSFPEEPEEEIEKIGLQHFEELVSAIMKVNNLEGKKKAEPTMPLDSSEETPSQST